VNPGLCHFAERSWRCNRPFDRQAKAVYGAEAAFWGSQRNVGRHRAIQTAAELQRTLGLMPVAIIWDRRATVSLGGRDGDGRPTVVLSTKVPLHEVLHELAHAWLEAEHPERFAWHGPEWVRCYLLLVETVMGSRKARRLAKAFARHGVNVTEGLVAA